MAIFWPILGFKGKTFELWVLINRWVLSKYPTEGSFQLSHTPEGQKNILTITLEYTSEPVNSCCIQSFAVYISDTSVTLKQSQGHQTLNDNVDQNKKDIIKQSWKDLALMVPKKKPTLKNLKKIVKYVNYLLWTCDKIKNSWIFMIYLK